LKGGDPAAGSPTATLLRLHPSRWSYRSQMFPKILHFALRCNQLPWCDGRCVQDPGTYSPRRADPRLLVIPASCTRVAEYNPNWGIFLGFARSRLFASHCKCHCSTCVAQHVRAMRTWRHPHLPPAYHWQFFQSAQLNDGN